MNKPGNQIALREKLMAPIAKIVSKHKAELMPLLKGKSIALSRSTLENDAAMQRFAEFCHDKLPFFLRLLVREERFVNFVMHNRAFILDRLPIADMMGPPQPPDK